MYKSSRRILPGTVCRPKEVYDHCCFVCSFLVVIVSGCNWCACLCRKIVAPIVKSATPINRDLYFFLYFSYTHFWLHPLFWCIYVWNGNLLHTGCFSFVCSGRMITLEMHIKRKEPRNKDSNQYYFRYNIVLCIRTYS